MAIIELEDEIVRISNLLDRNPSLIDREVKDLIDEYQQLSTVVIKIRDRILSLNPKVYLYVNERKEMMKDVFRDIKMAVSLCLRERELGKASAFKKFARILDSDFLGGLNLFERELETLESRDEATKAFNKLVMNPLLKALAELKQEIQNEKVRAEKAKKGLSKA